MVLWPNGYDKLLKTHGTIIKQVQMVDNWIIGSG